MIADDMMTFIKNDIVVFGVGVLLFIIATLWFVFRKLIWIIVPISSCFFSVIIMTGLLRSFKLESYSNLIKFYCIHVNFNYGHEYSYKYKIFQLKKNFQIFSNLEIMKKTTGKMFWPILYTVLTTILCIFISSI